MSLHRALRQALLLSLLSFVPALGLTAQPATGPVEAAELYRTIAALDSAVFDAYNRCDVERFGSYFAEDLEFYHDRGGLTRTRDSLLVAIRDNICGKVHRDHVPETLEVYPMANFGAVQMGEHVFCDARTFTVCGADSGIAKYIHLWEQRDGRWRITRVISYDHVDSHQRRR